MKLPKPILLIAFVWLVLSSATAQASLVYANSVVDSNAIHFLPTGIPSSSIDDVLGAPVYSPLEGIRLSLNATSAPTVDSYLTVAMESAVSGTLWVFSDDNVPVTGGFVADERFDLWVSNDNGANYLEVGTFYNDNAAINISSFGPVTHVKLIGNLDTICQNFGPTGCEDYSNAMEVLAIGGIASVPVPAAVWLFGSGLLGLIATGRRRNK